MIIIEHSHWFVSIFLRPKTDMVWKWCAQIQPLPQLSTQTIIIIIYCRMGGGVCDILQANNDCFVQERHTTLTFSMKGAIKSTERLAVWQRGMMFQHLVVSPCFKATFYHKILTSSHACADIHRHHHYHHLHHISVHWSSETQTCQCRLPAKCLESSITRLWWWPSWSRRHHMSVKVAIMVSTSLHVCEGGLQGVDIITCLWRRSSWCPRHHMSVKVAFKVSTSSHVCEEGHHGVDVITCLWRWPSRCRRQSMSVVSTSSHV